MNKHLNNWLDEVEGLAPETSNSNIKKEMKRQGYELTPVNHMDKEVKEKLENMEF